MKNGDDKLLFVWPKMSYGYILLCRLSISGSGKMVYSHEICPSWSVNSYIQSLQQADGLSPRDLYWRIWSLVNLLQCETCHSSFQCCDLMQCPYHPEGTLCSGTTYLCCSQRATQFSLILPAQVIQWNLQEKDTIEITQGCTKKQTFKCLQENLPMNYSDARFFCCCCCCWVVVFWGGGGGSVWPCETTSYHTVPPNSM